MLWRPLGRLVGYGLGSEGATWATSRELLAPLFSARTVAGLLELTATAVTEAVAELDGDARAGRPLDAEITMTRIVNRAVGRAFFGERISIADADRLGRAIARAFTSLGARLLLPFVPDAVPLPGSRAFGRAVREVDDIVYPLIARSRAGGAVDPGSADRTGGAGGAGADVVSLLCRARDRNGRGLDDRQVRDDLVAVYVAGVETTAAALTWLWVALERYPAVASRLRTEVAGAGADGPADGRLARLPYTRMVLRELLRLYPSGWIIPRRVARADQLAGVRLSVGSTVLVSPYVTHRLPALWDRPDEFRPERFEPGGDRQRHRFAYVPFGAGPHQCLGGHFFTMEAQLIVAAMLTRYEVTVPEVGSAAPRAGVTLRPRRPVRLLLRPLGGR
jgi:cytochrome P450